MIQSKNRPRKPNQLFTSEPLFALLVRVCLRLQVSPVSWHSVLRVQHQRLQCPRSSGSFRPSGSLRQCILFVSFTVSMSCSATPVFLPQHLCLGELLSETCFGVAHRESQWAIHANKIIPTSFHTLFNALCRLPSFPPVPSVLLQLFFCPVVITLLWRWSCSEIFINSPRFILLCKHFRMEGHFRPFVIVFFPKSEAFIPPAVFGGTKYQHEKEEANSWNVCFFSKKQKLFHVGSQFMMGIDSNIPTHRRHLLLCKSFATASCSLENSWDLDFLCWLPRVFRAVVFLCHLSPV